MKVHVCRCKQYRAKKRSWSAKIRRKFKRHVNKTRRRLKIGQIVNFYPA